MLLRGLRVPPLGSFREKIMGEMLQREQNSQFAFSQLLVSLIGNMFNISSDILTTYLKEYGLALFHHKYTKEYARYLKEKKKVEVEEELTLERRMQKLDALEITEEEYKEMLEPHVEKQRKKRVIT